LFLHRQVIYKDRVQVVPKLIKVPEAGKVQIVHKPVPHPVHGHAIYVPRSFSGFRPGDWVGVFENPF